MKEDGPAKYRRGLFYSDATNGAGLSDGGRPANGKASITQFRMDFIKVNLIQGHLVAGVFKIVFEEIEITFVYFVDEMHRQIVEIVLNRMGALGAMSLAFVETGNISQIDLMRGFYGIENRLHAFIELFSEYNAVVPASVQNECGHMA